MILLLIIIKISFFFFFFFFFQKLIVKSEMFDLLRNYEILKSEKNLYLLPESFQSLTTMTNEIPLKLCSYQSFFKKCSSLLYHFNIDTSITAEDGRRLAYEIDFYFNELFNDHLINIQAYLDKSKEKKKEKENEKIGKKNDDQKFDTEEPHNKFFSNFNFYYYYIYFLFFLFFYFLTFIFI